MRTFRRFTLCALLLLSPQISQADVVLDWNVKMLETLAGQSPFATARFSAITQLGVFEAVNAIERTHEPYFSVIEALPGASADAAAAAAAHAVLRHYFPLQAAPLDAALAASLSMLADGDAKRDGIATGVAAAQSMIALRANDGSGTAKLYMPASTAPGQWQRTPSCPAGGGTNFHWRDVTPFAIPAGSAFRLGPPPMLHEGGYAKDFAEVAAMGEIGSTQRPLDRENAARFYAAFSPVSWANSAARQIAAAGARSTAENARAFALLNMAISDAAVAAFDTKYHYNLWRPETAIKAADLDGNDKTAVDFGFLPLITAPCFPAYPSAHGTLSAAAREVLERLYGPTGHDITFTIAAFPQMVWRYQSFKSIVEDISDARVFGGIHFRFDQVGGEHQGKAVGAHVFKNHLRPVHPG